VANNTCNYNTVGIRLGWSDYNTIDSNTCLGNTEHDILEEYVSEETVFDESGTEASGSGVLLLLGFVGYTGFVVITLLAALILGKRVSKGE